MAYPKRVVYLLVLMLLSIPSLVATSSAQSFQDNQSRTCKIYADWNFSQVNQEDILTHSYRTSFHPDFPASVDPTNVMVNAIHMSSENLEKGTALVIVAGGEIDIQMTEPPDYGDSITISVESSEASCDRSFDVSIWNQPLRDHEVTRETSWSISSEDELTSLAVIARGWQERQGETLEANELGNGSINLNLDDENRQIDVDLNITKAWLNETWNGSNLIRQTFELTGSGNIHLQLDDGLSGIDAEGTVRAAKYERILQGGVVSENLELEANGTLFLNSDEDGRTDLTGEISLLRFETSDIDGQRVLQDIWIEATASAIIEFGSDKIEFELNEFIFREKWENSTRTEQHLKFKGDGEFDVLIEDEEGIEIEVNGTIDKIHTEQINGMLIEDTLLLDGEYTGTVSGTFGSIRGISDNGTQVNSSGIEHHVLVIRDEYWFNVSGSEVTLPGQTLFSEHNLTFEYRTPNIDWESPIVRYRYVEDSGEVNNEFPQNSPIILDPTPPTASSVLNSNVSRESGLSPDVLVQGDRIDLISDQQLSMTLIVTNETASQIDGHPVRSVSWSGYYPGGGTANGTTVNEGILAGTIISCSRSIPLQQDQNASAYFTESQSIVRVLRPSVITEAENTIPEIVEVSYREGDWYAEGGEVHLEITIHDPDTDVVSVVVDFGELGLGLVEMSDSGLLGDQKIQDDTWTLKVKSIGTVHGDIEVSVTIVDIWTTVSYDTSLILTNPGPRILDVDQNPYRILRGDVFSLSVTAEDLHGVSEIYIDLRQYGGEIFYLEKDSEQWRGSTYMPLGIKPGEVGLTVVLIDNLGARSIYSASEGLSPSFLIQNEPPSFSIIQFLRQDKIANEYQLTEYQVFTSTEEPISHILEVSVTDPDGISVVQAKIGRLAPIGSSDKWLNLNDNGLDGDRLSNDGIYTLEFDVRTSIEPGTMDIQIRAFDLYQSMTPEDQQRHRLTLVSNEQTLDSNWLEDNAGNISILIASLLLIGATTAIVRVFVLDDKRS